MKMNEKYLENLPVNKRIEYKIDLHINGVSMSSAKWLIQILTLITIVPVMVAGEIIIAAKLILVCYAIVGMLTLLELNINQRVLNKVNKKYKTFLEEEDEGNKISETERESNQLRNERESDNSDREHTEQSRLGGTTLDPEVSERTSEQEETTNDNTGQSSKPETEWVSEEIHERREGRE